METEKVNILVTSFSLAQNKTFSLSDPKLEEVVNTTRTLSVLDRGLRANKVTGTMVTIMQKSELYNPGMDPI